MAIVTYTPVPDLMSLQEYARSRGKGKLDLEIVRDFFELYTIPESGQEINWYDDSPNSTRPMNNRGRMRLLRHFAERLLQLAQEMLDRIRCRRSASKA